MSQQMEIEFEECKFKLVKTKPPQKTAAEARRFKKTARGSSHTVLFEILTRSTLQKVKMQTFSYLHRREYSGMVSDRAHVHAHIILS